MKTITVHVPDDTFSEESEAQQFLAAKLYETGKLSLGQVAEMLNMTKTDVVAVLAHFNVDFFGQSPGEIETARRFVVS